MFLRSLLLPLIVLVAACGGGKKDTPEPQPQTKVDAGAGKPPPTNQRLVDGQKLWTTYCALCHGPEAQGYAADHAPSLVSPTFLATVTDVFLRSSISSGRPGTSMAGYGKEVGGPLSDDDILKIIAWVRSLHTIDRVRAEPPRAGDATRGAVVYEANCKVCHGDPQKRADWVWLANGAFLSMASDAFLRYAIANGRPGTEMRAWAGALTDTQIDDLVALLRNWAPSEPQQPQQPQRPDVPKPPSLDDMPLVINPKGKAPTFTLREDRFVPAAQVKKALDEKRKMIIVDARAASDWNMMRIPGALPVPYYAMDEVGKLPNDDTWILTYCACPHHASGEVLDELRRRGYKHTAIIDEGILFWQQQGYPIEGAGPPKVPQQP